MIVCDFILANIDRHFNNFGAIRNIETLEFKRVAPIFDNGCSLWFDENDMYVGESFLTEPFKEYEKNHNLENPKHIFHYLNPEHPDNNPSMRYTSKLDICKCFSCGVNYDIFDLVCLDYNLDNFRNQLLKVEELYLGYNLTNRKEFNNDNVVHDYIKYFNWYTPYILTKHFSYII